MNKKLVFAFYLSDNYKSEIINIHFECLKRFSYAFDSAEIVFILDNEYDIDNLYSAEERFTKIFIGKPLSFSMISNSKYREAIVFYEYIAKKLVDNELVFFAHNKGVTNVNIFPVEQIYTWVVAMYYYSLNYMGEVEDQLLNKKYLSYGPFLTQNNEMEKPTKYGWYYIGTFFWLNGRKIWQYMQNNEIQLPALGDRFYAEEFLSNIYPSWPYVMAGSHNTRYLMDCADFYYKTTDYLRACYDVDNEGFYEFYNSVLKNGETY